MRRTACLLSLSLLLLGACGDDADDAATPAAETTSSSTSTSISTTTSTTVVSPVPSTTAVAASTQKCKTVGFSPNSEDAASDVTARGLSCAEAERFVEIAGRRTSSGGPDRVSVEGYTCQRTRYEDEPLPRSYYSCTSGSKTVTFVRS
ncbi:MAG TPA: hypothetical protein VNB24_00885 [Acidimicrobiales bacterium]|nr:hypothetical protein [Acidimicrobiales bacterium]